MSENKYTFFEKDLTDLIKSDLKFNLLNLIYDNVSILLDKDEYNYTSEITDIKDEIYKVENSNNYVMGPNGSIYIIYAYGNSSFTSDNDVVYIKPN